MTTVPIGNRLVGDGEPAFVVAEIGGNHDGQIEQAYRLIGTAAEAGADAAKFQFFEASELYPGRQTPGAIPAWWLEDLAACCKVVGLEFLASVFSTGTLNAYLETDPVAVKIASPEATNPVLLEAAAQSGVPLIVSTGAMTWDDLDATMLVLAGYETILLHCVSAYPAPLAESNLAVLPEMGYRFGVPVGLSDHSVHNLLLPVLAVGVGARLIEKHLTLDRNLPGPDHPFALEPAEFKAMVGAVREAEEALGDGVKKVQPSEDSTDRRSLPPPGSIVYGQFESHDLGSQ